MTAVDDMAQAMSIAAGAPARAEVEWLQVNWKHALASVKRLQVRIAKATLEGRWGKVKALQHLLTRSHSGKTVAVKRVTENRGKRTPGVDGKIWSTPGAKWQGVQSLRHRGYRALPLRRVYIPKSNGKKRPLGIPCMRCRAMQALWKLALEPVAESLADPNSYGFRPERSAADAIEQCFISLGRSRSPEWILEGDIRGCYDNISHPWLLKHIPMDKQILQRWLQAGYIDEGTLFDSAAGTPQGGIISPTLSNMTLDGLEAAVFASVGGSTEHARRKSKVNVIRYADDFCVTGISKELLESKVLPAVKKFLASRGLELSDEKTRITHISEGFDFLGQNVRKYKGKLLIKPAKKSVKSLFNKVRAIVKHHANATQSVVIQRLNPVIRGWAMYHRHIVAKAVFSSVDWHIWKLLWKWALRRHPTKGARWVRNRYFHTVGQFSWDFATDSSVGGTKYRLRLFRAATVSITKHVKVQALANPFDPAWRSYFIHRRTMKSSVGEPSAISAWC